MMADFNTAVRMLIEDAEKGFANSPHDKGGFTFAGISLRFLKSLGRKGDINGDGVVDNADIIALSKNDPAVRTLYREHFWNFYRIGEIQSQTVANRVFFLFVNTKPFLAAKVVQRAVNALSPGKIHEDGRIGSVTIQAVNALDSELFLNAFRLECIRLYLMIADNDPEQRPNFRGWVRRALM
jgi:lysozyme family protein